MADPVSPARSILSGISPEKRRRRWRRRRLLDLCTRYGMGIGGIGVIVAILLIFFYLLYVVFPLFVPAGLERSGRYPLPAPAAGATAHLALEEQNEVAVRFTDTGRAVFFKVADGSVLREQALPLPAGVRVSAFAHGRLSRGLVAYGTTDGRILLAHHRYETTYPGGRRLITPGLELPLGPEAVVVDPRRRPLRRIAVELSEDGATLVAETADGRLLLTALEKEEGGLDEDEVQWRRTRSELPRLGPVQELLVDPEQRTLYVAETGGEVTALDIGDKAAPRLLERVRLLEPGAELTVLRFLTGGISLLAGGSDGRIHQWFPVRDADHRPRLTHIRAFALGDAAVTAIVTEQRRKGFLAADAAGRLGVFHTTAGRTLILQKLSRGPVQQLAVSPRADTALLQDAQGRIQRLALYNEHPEVSWSALWQRVWYESYPGPEYVWQSSSASNDFEPKFSLMPLTFGTLKAAFYAMLFAVPLAIMGAVYTAYFMSPRMRAVVKPTVEIMEALPTVILGFLAGLWLAPFLEAHLPGVFLLLLVLPPGVLVFAWAWQRLPARLRQRVPEGWQAALLIPVLLVLGAAALGSSVQVERALFGGDMRVWLDTTLGLDFDQRNALVVGLAMGVAVIPTIFSITEDAIFSVPRHLSFGALALGATPWQTLVGVVILTASPGIFSAVMIGLGRAVGETMIVLMATGNTPVMDFSIFQGMRTLSANIAVEMPESEVDSTHYRVLFLAALVLFLFTFAFNTLAELVRQRLRKKYSTL